MPEIVIDLRKIEHNASSLNKFLAKRNLSLIGVTKVVLGNPNIANALIEAGIEYLGDSRITNIIKMKKA